MKYAVPLLYLNGDGPAGRQHFDPFLRDPRAFVARIPGL